MFDLLHAIYDIFLELMMWGGPEGLPPDVLLAIDPLTIAGIATLAGGALGATNYALGAKERNRLKDRANRIDALRGESSEALDEQIGEIGDLAEGIDTDKSAEELYGPTIESLQDRVEGGRAQTGRQVMRSLMAGGGDITGSVNATLQKLTAQSNKSIMDIMGEYNKRTDRRNLQEKQRKSNLLSTAMQGRQSQMASLSSAADQAFGRSARKATADKQFLMDSIGLGANVGSMFMGQGGSGGSA